MVVDARVLVHHDVNLPIKLQCDTSPYAVRAVLSHVMDSGEDRPIAFASRTLTSSERNYAQIQREALALLFGVKQFHQYIFGRKFTLVTDHKPLLTILGPKTAVPSLAATRLQRWALTLAAYNYDSESRKGSEHANADCFSRLPCKSQTTVDGNDDDNEVHAVYRDELPVNSKDIAHVTRRDPVLARVYEHTMNGWPDKIKDEQLKPYFKH